MASIVGTSVRVVEAPGLSIDELVGNVATNQDDVSVANVTASKGTAEPWLTLGYDEWICVTSGAVVIEEEGKPPLTVPAGRTVMLPKGTRFRPSFPEDTSYIPICVPAFRPDRCIREDTDADGAAISSNLQKLHKKDGEPKKKEEPPEVLYHMLAKEEWEKAKAKGDACEFAVRFSLVPVSPSSPAHQSLSQSNRITCSLLTLLSSHSPDFPPTFEADSFLTHATGVPSRLISTANHYYQNVPGDWICLEFTRSSLRKRGIFVRDEHATPVGATGTDSEMMADWVCPHVIGGIPLDVVQKTYAMVREGEKYLRIEGLTE